MARENEWSFALGSHPSTSSEVSSLDFVSHWQSWVRSRLESSSDVIDTQTVLRSLFFLHLKIKKTFRLRPPFHLIGFVFTVFRMKKKQRRRRGKRNYQLKVSHFRVLLVYFLHDVDDKKKFLGIQVFLYFFCLCSTRNARPSCCMYKVSYHLF